MAGTLCASTSLNLMPFEFESCHFPIRQIFKFGPVIITQLQGHFMLCSLFASTIGPFGGFFASGIKRSVKIKDFGNTIPGHGGVSDRMDCQLIMGAFVYFYHQSFIKVAVISTPAYILSQLTPSEQLALFKMLKANLSSLNMI
jgi:phosphatidate cytidylyltransferase